MPTSQIASISVVIPAYNRARTIGYCLDSVLSQSYPPTEIIVVDDSSTDETVDIVRNYNSLKILCVVLEKKSGAQAARNRGIWEAKGDWIAFQDSDDEWLPDKLEKQLAALVQVNFNPMTVVHGDCFVFNQNKNESYVWNLPLVHGTDVFTKLLESPGPVFPSLLTSKIALEKIGFLDEQVPSYQEWDTAIRLARECEFIHIREPLFTYHQHQWETISKDKRRDIEGYQYIINKFNDDIIALCGEGVWCKHQRIQMFRCIDFRMWQDAERYLLDLIPKCGFACQILNFFRYFHLTSLMITMACFYLRTRIRIKQWGNRHT